MQSFLLKTERGGRLKDCASPRDFLHDQLSKIKSMNVICCFLKVFNFKRKQNTDATYHSSSINPLGGSPNLRHSRGGFKDKGLIREWALLTKSNHKDINDSRLVLLHQIVQIQYILLRVKYINPTQFYSKTYED